MRNAKYIPIVMVATLSLLSCYLPALPDDPFLCGEGGKCPEGYTCYGGTCLKHEPACMSSTSPEFLGWPDDSDLEPNDHPDLAVTLPCGDDGIVNSPAEYVARCPTRQNYTNWFMNLLTCPNGDRDFYKIYLLPEEAVTFRVLYNYGNGTLPRDIDARVWRWDFPNNDWKNDVVLGGQSTNDNEELTFTTALASGNPQGWYYLEIYGKTYQDLNYYTVSFTLNASQI
jgi:hypothetical protein